MSSLWDRANSIEWSAGVPAAGALAYFFVGGTTTPLVVTSDAGGGTPITTPVVADANGRWPDVFIPYIASYDVKVTTSAGTQLYYPRLIPNPDPSAAAATGTILTSSSQLFQTGGMRFEVAIGAAPSGWVRANGLTIGNATSSATERANADTAALFAFLWNAAPDAVLPVSTGRGGSAAGDFALNKRITLPDMRGGLAIGADDMGNSAAGRFATATFAAGSATVGASVVGGDAGGGNVRTILTANLAAHNHNTGTLTNATESAHTHPGTTALSVTDHTHSVGTLATDSQGAHTHTPTGVELSGGGGSGFAAGALAAGSPATSSDGAHTHTISGNTGGLSASHSHTFTTNAGSAHSHNISGLTGSTGSDAPLSVLSRSTLGTWLIKL